MDHNKLRALKERRGIFAAFGQTEKVKAIDAEIAKLRAADESAPEPEAKAEAPSRGVETGEADLTGVETAAVVRRPRGRSRKS